MEQSKIISVWAGFEIGFMHDYQKDVLLIRAAKVATSSGYKHYSLRVLTRIPAITMAPL